MYLKHFETEGCLIVCTSENVCTPAHPTVSFCVRVYRLGGVGVLWWAETTGIEIIQGAETISEGISTR